MPFSYHQVSIQLADYSDNRNGALRAGEGSAGDGEAG